MIRFLWIKFRYKQLFFLHQNVQIKGIRNIKSNKKINIGISYVGFMHKSEKTLLNINGELEFEGNYSIGRGCRLDIGEKGKVRIGNGGYINCNSTLIIMNSLSIGHNCVISWNCSFLDEDFHDLYYEGRKEVDNSIIIGDNVWIGCGVHIYKGSFVADGCVIASNSVVKGVFKKPNCLIGGHPARILKENIKWD